MENFSPERKTTISTVVGGTVESDGKINRLFEYAFEHQERFPGEREKSPEEFELIDDLNLRLKDFTESFGGSFVPIPERNIHVVDLDAKEIVESRRGPPFTGAGVFNPLWQGIAVHHPNPEPSLRFAINLVHEMLHFESFQSVKVGKDEQSGLRRVGLVVYNGDGTVARFGRLDEAVITELGKRFDQRFFEDIRYTRQLAEIRNREVANSKAEPPSAEARKILEDVATLEELEALPDGQRRVRINPYAYLNERRDLWALIDRVDESLGGAKGREAIFALFARAVFSGRLLPLARVLERAFGKDSFQILAEQTADRSDSETVRHNQRED